MMDYVVGFSLALMAWVALQWQLRLARDVAEAELKWRQKVESQTELYAARADLEKLRTMVGNIHLDMEEVAARVKVRRHG